MKTQLLRMVYINILKRKWLLFKYIFCLIFIYLMQIFFAASTHRGLNFYAIFLLLIYL